MSFSYLIYFQVRVTKRYCFVCMQTKDSKLIKTALSLQRFADIQANLFLLPLQRFWFPALKIGIKRECSVNLQLSRSCKLCNGFSFYKPLFSSENGKVEKPGVSQNTCHQRIIS